MMRPCAYLRLANRIPSLSSNILISLTFQRYTLHYGLDIAIVKSRACSNMNLTENATPQPGKTYAINKKGSDTVVTLVDGSRVAMRYWEGLPIQKWECVEKDGWLGFVSRASTAYDRGAYMGHDSGETLICARPHHRDDEYFQVVLHDEGFAWEIRKDNRLGFIGITDGGSRLKISAKGTTWWGFTAIDGATGGQPSYAPSTRSLSVDAPQMKLVLHW